MQGAIVTMTKCLAKELVKSHGIRVNAGMPRLMSQCHAFQTLMFRSHSRSGTFHSNAC